MKIIRILIKLITDFFKEDLEVMIEKKKDIIDERKDIINNIVSIFETGRITDFKGYSTVTSLEGDSGGLTYGKHQTTLNSGGLFFLISLYIENNVRSNRKDHLPFLPFLERLEQKDNSLNYDSKFKKILERAGSDPIMRLCQDDFFDRNYWIPAKNKLKEMNFSFPLTLAITYDSFIHGSFNTINKAIGKETDEKKWASKYNEERFNWLSTHKKPLLRKSVYRQNEFRKIINDNNFDLNEPLRVRGIDLYPYKKVDSVFTKVNVLERILKLKTPLMYGEDVKLVQQQLKENGYKISVDGYYGKDTEALIKDFQRKNSLLDDGIVGSVTFNLLF
jgi:chitosanase